MIIGDAAMGLQHGQYWREDDARLSNVYLSILRSMNIETDSFSDSTGAIANTIFTRA